MYTYRQIFKQAFKIAWQSPGLWFFGFFVTLLGSAGELEIILSSYSFGNQGVLFSFWQGLAQGGLLTPRGLSGFIQSLFSNPLYFFIISLIFLFVLGVSILIVWLVVVSQSALISQVVSVSSSRQLKWSQAFGLGLIKFWPVLGLNVLLRLVIWLLFAISTVLAIFNFPGLILVFIVSFDIFLIVILTVSFIAKYAIAGVVLKGWRFRQAIQLAWKLFIANWLLSLEVAVILFAIYFFTNLFLFFILSWFLFYSLTIYASFTFGLVLLLLALLGLILFIQILLTIFYWASWTIIFELISRREAVLTSRLKSGFVKMFG